MKNFKHIQKEFYSELLAVYFLDSIKFIKLTLSHSIHLLIHTVSLYKYINIYSYLIYICYLSVCLHASPEMSMHMIKTFIIDHDWIMELRVTEFLLFLYTSVLSRH
jgi:hypothetical protein